MGVFSFVNNIIDKIEQHNIETEEKRKQKIIGEKEFSDRLNEIIENSLDDGAIQLREIQNKYSIDNKFYENQITKAFKSLAEKYLSDNIVTEDEYNHLMKVANSLSITIVESSMDTLNLKHEIWQVQEKGLLPIIDHSTLPIILKKKETVHYSGNASLKKYKTITKSVNFAGPSFSFKICKGVRYRAGSFNVGKTTSTYIDTIDNGIFFITNQRVAFVGSSKNFSYPIDKIIKTDITSDGLVIQKENTMSSQIISLYEYELPLCILSSVINQHC